MWSVRRRDGSSEEVAPGTMDVCEMTATLRTRIKEPSKMPFNKKVHATSSTSTSRKPVAKAAGTRVGLLSDWRQDSGRFVKSPAERRNALRDGR